MSIIGLIPGNLAGHLESGLATLSRFADSPKATSFTSDISLGVCDRSGMSRTETCRVLLDGRIDNLPELSQRLGVPSTSPVHLLAHAYLRWRDEFPKHIFGDFAFAIWDEAELRLLLGRDAMGYRPLHYCVRGEEFLFASEVRALLSLPGMRMVPDEKKVAAWLGFVADYSSRTFFEGVSRVAPGHTVLYEGGRVTVRRYWEPEKQPLLRLTDPREYAEGLRCVLEQAVRDRITPGRRIGSQLSGGLDSSSVVAMAAPLLAERGQRLTAFTAVPAETVESTLFPERFADERSTAGSVAERYSNVDHVLISNRADGVFAALDEMSTATERPQLNCMNSIWINAINREANQRGLDVLLDGAIGNCTISYNGERALPMALRHRQLRAANRLIHGYRSAGRSRFSIANLALRPLLPAFIGYTVDALRGASSEVADATGARVGFLRAHGHGRHEFPVIARIVEGKAVRLRTLAGIDLGMYVAAAHRLHGIEQSNPTADRRVVEYCLSVPEEQFCLGGRDRSLIRDAMTGRLPDAVRLEKRRGLQGADFFAHLSAERDEIVRELDRMRQSPLIARAIDIPALDGMLARWPAKLADSHEWLQYCLKLTRAISIGRFVRRIEDGTLFSPLNSAPE